MRRCLVENYQGDTWLSCSMDGAIKSMSGSTGSEWKKIGDNGRNFHSLDIIGIHS